MSAILAFVADASDVQQVASNDKNLLFMGVFFIALIIVAIWWLKRSA